MADPYAFGSRSVETRRLQLALTAKGFDPGTPDGIMGRQTRAAVEAAQQRLGLAATGLVDDRLLIGLGLEAPPPAPKPITDFLTGLLLQWLTTSLKGWIPMNFLAGYKTYIVAGVMLVTGIAGVLGVDIPSFTGQAPGELVMEALAFFFLRQGLKTDAKG